MAMAMAMAMATTMASDDATIISDPSKAFARRVPKRVRVGGREAEILARGMNPPRERATAAAPNSHTGEIVMSRVHIARS
jgi:hypothetical protein